MPSRFEQAKLYTEKYRSVLLPCRYCGNTDIRIVSGRTIFNPRNVWSVCCSTQSCDCTGDYPKVKDAVAAWNDMCKKKVGEQYG